MKTIALVTDNSMDQINGVMTTYRSLSGIAEVFGYSFQYVCADDMKTVPLPIYPEIRIGNPRNVGKLLKEIPFNYIHISTEGPIGLGAKLFCDRENIPYTTSYHTKFPEFAKQICYVPTVASYAYLKWFHSKSKQILVPTESVKNELIAHGFKNDISVWTRGVSSIYRLNRDNSILEHALRRPSDKPKVLYVGRVSAEKNIEELLKLHSHYNITIVGDGPMRTRYENQYPTVNFVGYKTGQELVDMYIESDVFAFPSKSDTFGIVMIEAISLGVPVAAHNVTGPKDVVNQGVNGYIGDDLKTQIDLCYNNLSKHRMSIIKSSHKWSWEQCWRVFADTLTNVV